MCHLTVGDRFSPLNTAMPRDEAQRCPGAVSQLLPSLQKMCSLQSESCYWELLFQASTFMKSSWCRSALELGKDKVFSVTGC